jgi:hypothetical protein
MNWYKISQQALPISIVSYVPSYGELGISFNGGKKYVYPKVSPHVYNKISILLSNKNYKKVQEMLKELSANNIPDTQEDREEIMEELYERGELK